MLEINDQELFEFILNDPIYTEKSEISDGNIEEFFNDISRTVKGDSYCPECNEKTTYTCRSGESHSLRMSASGSGGKLIKASMKSEDIFIVRSHCARNYSHSVISAFLLSEQNDLCTKIGQIPSVSDVSMPYSKYRSVLDPVSLREMSRADGLASHGVGIGSFVYLRRVYERIVDESFVPSPSCPDIVSFHKMDMKDRVKLVSHSMPETFIKCSSNLFGILSSGIHSLNEKECLEKYPTLRDIICLVLIKRKSDKDMADMENHLMSDINSMNSKKS